MQIVGAGEGQISPIRQRRIPCVSQANNVELVPAFAGTRAVQYGRAGPCAQFTALLSAHPRLITIHMHITRVLVSFGPAPGLPDTADGQGAMSTSQLVCFSIDRSFAQLCFFFFV